MWEPCCGGGHIADVLKKNGYDVHTSDIKYRGYPLDETLDFLGDHSLFIGDIITNPPYKNCVDFVYKALDTVANGYYVAMLFKLTFLESMKRRELFDSQPFKHLFVFSKRISPAKGGDFEKYQDKNAIAYGWYVWEKGFKGKPTISWI